MACKASRRPQGRARKANGGLTISRRGIWDWDDLPGLSRANADALAWRPCRARSVSPFPVIRCSRADPISRFLRQCWERPNGPLQLSDPDHHGELYPLQRGPTDRSGRGRAAAKAFGVGSAPVKLTAPRSQRQASGPLSVGGDSQAATATLLRMRVGKRTGRPAGTSPASRPFVAAQLWTRAMSGPSPIPIEGPTAGTFSRVLLDLGFNVAGNLIDREARLLLARRIFHEQKASKPTLTWSRLSSRRRRDTSSEPVWEEIPCSLRLHPKD